MEARAWYRRRHPLGQEQGGGLDSKEGERVGEGREKLVPTVGYFQ